ncbi:MAG TPA: DUF1287 domain-containing protein [Pyrinomonadaceae bacterium]|jgi:hypothetical protein
MSRIIAVMLFVAYAILATACQQVARMQSVPRSSSSASNARRATTPINSPVVQRVVDDAIAQADYTLYYDPAYVQLDYPGGDVPPDRGVCSDVIIRAFRKGGVDLQKEVHEDMARSFSSYPQRWGLSGPDANIDHRRVPNLMTYFKRQGKALSITKDARDYLPGDVVTWNLSGGATHIGLVTNIISETSGAHLMAHNMGAARVEDVLFAWEITGHYRYFQ